MAQFKYKMTKGQIQTEAAELLKDMKGTISDLTRKVWEEDALAANDWEGGWAWWWRRRLDEDATKVLVALIETTSPQTKLRDRELFIYCLLWPIPEEQRNAILDHKKLRKVREGYDV